MALLRELVPLHSGFSIPRIGFGTYQLAGAQCLEATQAALAAGYIHIDTAQLYRNEPVIAQALRGYDRSQLFLTSKVGPSQQGYDQARSACEKSLESLQTSYLDLMLVHWPGVSGMALDDPRIVEVRHDTWRALEDLQQAGKIRSIGVSNFLVPHLEKLLRECRIRPSVNQVEYHPLCHDEALVQYCRDQHIVVEAYSPLARAHADLWKHPVVQRLCQVHQCTEAQLLLRWCYQKDVVLLPKSAKPDRVRANTHLGFVLTEEEMREIDGLHTGKRTCWDPTTVRH